MGGLQTPAFTPQALCSKCVSLTEKHNCIMYTCMYVCNRCDCDMVWTIVCLYCHCPYTVFILETPTTRLCMGAGKKR